MDSEFVVTSLWQHRALAVRTWAPSPGEKQPGPGSPIAVVMGTRVLLALRSHVTHMFLSALATVSSMHEAFAKCWHFTYFSFFNHERFPLTHSVLNLCLVYHLQWGLLVNFLVHRLLSFLWALTMTVEFSVTWDFSKELSVHLCFSFSLQFLWR